jgi:hypothetical protein
MEIEWRFYEDSMESIRRFYGECEEILWRLYGDSM